MPKYPKIILAESEFDRGYAGTMLISKLLREHGVSEDDRNKFLDEVAEAAASLLSETPIDMLGVARRWISVVEDSQAN